MDKYIVVSKYEELEISPIFSSLQDAQQYSKDVFNATPEFVDETIMHDGVTIVIRTLAL